MAALAAMIATGLPLRCVAVTGYGGYDTHDAQPKDLADGLKAVSDTLLAFQRDLEARGVADRVLTQVWSEFGRRGEENASQGTDHGAAGIGFRSERAPAGWSASIPAWRRWMTTATSAPRPISAASTARCSSSGSARTPQRWCRTRGGSGGRLY
jgi:hypothetical protein